MDILSWQDFIGGILAWQACGSGISAMANLLVPLVNDLLNGFLFVVFMYLFVLQGLIFMSGSVSWCLNKLARPLLKSGCCLF